MIKDEMAFRGAPGVNSDIIMTRDEEIRIQARHLHEVEGLSFRQIGGLLGVSRKKISRLLSAPAPKKPEKKLLIRPYERLIEEW